MLYLLILISCNTNKEDKLNFDTNFTPFAISYVCLFIRFLARQMCLGCNVKDGVYAKQQNEYCKETSAAITGSSRNLLLVFLLRLRVKCYETLNMNFLCTFIVLRLIKELV